MTRFDPIDVRRRNEEDFSRIRQALVSTEAEPEDGEILAGVRRRVLARIAARPTNRRLRLAAVGGLALVIVASYLWTAASTPRQTARSASAQPPRESLDLSSPPEHLGPARNALPRVVAENPPLALATLPYDNAPLRTSGSDSTGIIAVGAAEGAELAKNEDLLLQFESDNRDILIYWLIEPAGG